jgi:hypothetical protein
MSLLTRSLRRAALFLVLCLVTTVRGQVANSSPHSVPRAAPPAGENLLMTVVDENDVAVPSARVFLQSSLAVLQLKCETDFAGHGSFQGLVAGRYQLRVEKEGFYAVSPTPVQVGQTPAVDVKLSHLQEVREVVNVVESPPGIDPAETASSEQLTGLDVLNIPYPATHDYRNALNFIPGVMRDSSGQPHILGAETYQTLTLFDGFNVTQPANGMLLLRVSTDAIRSINVQRSRISAEQGKGSGGVLSINTGIGDDHYFFAATNFLPSFQFKKRFSFDQIIPRVTVSGPLKKGKVWFFEGFEGEYDNHIVPEITTGPDSDKFWRVGNLLKLQANIAPGNILTASYLFNHQHDQYVGLSVFSPASTTPSDTESGDFAIIKDQIYFPGDKLLDFGFNFDQYVSNLTPQGSQPYISSSQVAQGSFYLKSHTVARRWQAVTNLSLALHPRYGRHEVKFGIDVNRLAYNPIFQRDSISYLRIGQQPPVSGQTCLSVISSPCSRFSVFPVSPQAETHNIEAGGYAQDRWLLTSRLLVEGGLRFDWDEIVRHSLLSPRLATTYVLDSQGNTKLSAGIGVFYDPTNMELISRPFEGQRLDYFWLFDRNGNPVPVPGCATTSIPCAVSMTLTVNRGSLQAPRFLNWSVAIEHKLPVAVYLKAEFIQRHGTHGFVYNLPPGSPVLSGNYVLENTRQDHYDAFQISARKAFQQTYVVTASYVRSNTRSNQVLDFNVDNPIYGPQFPDPFPWDAPNRFLSTGILPAKLPLLHKVDVEYSAEARTGFPFYLVNNEQQLVTPRGSRRFPSQFSLNLFLEKRFEFRGRYWAIRGGFIDITGRGNPHLVNNNIDSPEFLTFGAFEHRAFTTRIRLLGRK